MYSQDRCIFTSIAGIVYDYTMARIVYDCTIVHSVNKCNAGAYIMPRVYTLLFVHTHLDRTIS